MLGRLFQRLCGQGVYGYAKNIGVKDGGLTFWARSGRYHSRRLWPNMHPLSETRNPFGGTRMHSGVYCSKLSIRCRCTRLIVLERSKESTRCLMSAPFFLAPLLIILKSGAMLTGVVLISKYALLLAATLRLYGARILTLWHGLHHPALQPPVTTQSSNKTSSLKRHFYRTTRLLVILPFGFLGLVVAASLEVTPIWGRWRIIAMSSDEEQRILYETLRPGLSHSSNNTRTPEAQAHEATYDQIESQDWLTILRNASGEEEADNPREFFSGYRVIKETEDWRVRWVSDVLHRLDSAIAASALQSAKRFQFVEPSSEAEPEDAPQALTFCIPPVKHSLTMRPALQTQFSHLGLDKLEEGVGPLTHHGNVVIETPISNVCSIGFGAALTHKPGSIHNSFGIVIITTGLLDDILGLTSPPENLDHLSLLKLWRSILRPKRKSATRDQTNQLAAILSHELSHILLAHYLETRASKKMYESLSTVLNDLAQTVLFSTFKNLLGPVLADSLNNHIRERSTALLSAVEDWASGIAETEADLFGMRILAAAGFDPRAMLDVLGDEGVFHRVEKKRAEEVRRQNEEGDHEKGGEDKSWLDRSVLVQKHPLSEQRYSKVQEELESWQRGDGEVLGESRGSFLD